MTTQSNGSAPAKPLKTAATTGKRKSTESDLAVGRRIRLLRRAAGLSLQELGNLIGVSCVQFQRYETGASRMAASRLFAISTALGVRIDRLMVDPASANPESRSPSQPVDAEELLALFDTISDPERRRAILALTRAIAGQEDTTDDRERKVESDEARE